MDNLDINPSQDFDGALYQQPARLTRYTDQLIRLTFGEQATAATRTTMRKSRRFGRRSRRRAIGWRFERVRARVSVAESGAWCAH